MQQKNDSRAEMTNIEAEISMQSQQEHISISNSQELFGKKEFILTVCLICTAFIGSFAYPLAEIFELNILHQILKVITIAAYIALPLYAVWLFGRFLNSSREKDEDNPVHRLALPLRVFNDYRVLIYGFILLLCYFFIRRPRFLENEYFFIISAMLVALGVIMDLLLYFKLKAIVQTSKENINSKWLESWHSFNKIALILYMIAAVILTFYAVL